MPRYMVTHKVKRVFETQEEWLQDWAGIRQRTKGAGEEDARWLGTWYSAPAKTMYCEWEAPSAGAIRKCFTSRELEMAPIEKIEEIVYIDPAWLD